MYFLTYLNSHTIISPILYVRKLSRGVFEFSSSRNQEVVEWDIKKGVLIPEFMFLKPNSVTQEWLS